MSHAALARVPMLGLTAAAAAMGSAAATAGAEWTFAPGAQMVTQAQDNPRFLEDGGETETSIGTRATFQVQRNTERLHLVANAVAGILRYQQDSNLDRNDQQLDIALSREGERFDWDARASMTRDTTLTSELGNTGVTQFNQRHENMDFSYSPSWVLSERLVAGAAVSWLVNRYPDPATNLVDYRYGSVSLNTNYMVSDRASLTVVGSVGHYDSGSALRDSDNAAVRLKAQYAWSPLWSVSFGAGPSWVESNGNRRQSIVYDVSLARRMELSSLTLLVSRSQSPSGLGVLTNLDTATLNFATQFSERLSGSASLGYIRRKEALPALRLDLQEVRYRYADVSVSWAVAPNWKVSLGTGNRAQQLATLSRNENAKNYEARLTVGWSGNPHVY